MTLGKTDGTGICKRQHSIALYGELTVDEAMGLSSRQTIIWMYEHRSLSRKTLYYTTDMFRLIAITGVRKDTYGKIYRIHTLILIKIIERSKNLRYIYIYICWRLAEMCQSYKIIFLTAQSLGTSILLHCSAQSKRVTKRALYLKLL